MNKFLMILVLVLISSKAFAEWTMIQTNDDGNMLIDFETLQKNENLITVSTLNDYYVRQAKGEMSSEWREVHDCKNKQFKALSIKYYAENMAKGSILATYLLPEAEIAWSAVVPYSVGEVKANVICSR
jgi:hypothetical protein